MSAMITRISEIVMVMATSRVRACPAVVQPLCRSVERGQEPVGRRPDDPVELGQGALLAVGVEGLLDEDGEVLPEAPQGGLERTLVVEQLPGGRCDALCLYFAINSPTVTLSLRNLSGSAPRPASVQND